MVQKGKKGTSLIFIPQGNFRLFHHLFGEHRGIIGGADVSVLTNHVTPAKVFMNSE